jgi:hypothetical protein
MLLTSLSEAKFPIKQNNVFYLPSICETRLVYSGISPVAIQNILRVTHGHEYYR